jgi:DNA-binding FadR family transcriptional regulator
VSVRHGGTSRILDYRESAGLDLLPALLVTGDGHIAVEVVRGVLEMRSAIAADAARLAASRANAAVGDRLDELCAAMRNAGDDLPVLQSLAIDFWSAIINASDNIAYRLAYNSLRETYDSCREILANALAEELRDAGGYTALATAIRRRDEASAQARARDLVRRGEAGIKRVLDGLDATRGAAS